MPMRSSKDSMPRNPTPTGASDAPAAPPGEPRAQPALLRVLYAVTGVVLAGALSGAMVLGIALAVAFPNLPDISDLSDYRPILPLRVFSVEGLIEAMEINGCYRLQLYGC